MITLRSFRRIHLLSLLLSVLIFGGLLGLNMQSRPLPDEWFTTYGDGVIKDDLHRMIVADLWAAHLYNQQGNWSNVDAREFGWPMTCYSHFELRETCLYRVWYRRRLAVDLLVIVLSTVLITFISEFLIRRKASVKPI